MDRTLVEQAIQGKDIQVFSSDGTYHRSVAAGHAGSFIAATGDGYVDTSLLPDDRPGLTEYKPDGSIQGGIDMPDMMPTPLGMTRDALNNLYVAGLTASDEPSTLVRFRANGRTQDVWNAGGLAVAVPPAGDAAYVLRNDAATLLRYDLPLPYSPAGQTSGRRLAPAARCDSLDVTTRAEDRIRSRLTSNTCSMQDDARTEQTFQSPMCPDGGRNTQAIQLPTLPRRLAARSPKWR